MLYLVSSDNVFSGKVTDANDAARAEYEALGWQCASFDEKPDFYLEWEKNQPDENGDGSITLTLAQLKTFKKAQVEDATEGFDARRKDPAMTFKSSLGFTVDGDARSRDNIEGLINVGAEPVSFKDHDNQLHSLSLDELKTLLVEAQKNGALLYQQKWALQAEIDACKSAKKLAAIKIEFTMADFSEEASNANQTASA